MSEYLGGGPSRSLPSLGQVSRGRGSILQQGMGEDGMAEAGRRWLLSFLNLEQSCPPIRRLLFTGLRPHCWEPPELDNSVRWKALGTTTWLKVLPEYPCPQREGLCVES